MASQSLTALVTGGAGFIGSALVRELIGGGVHRVVNVDKLTYAGNLDSLASVADSPRYCFEHADICDGAALQRVFARHRPDLVIHLAAESHVDRSIDSPGEFVRTNLVGTYELLQASLHYFRDLEPERASRFRFVQVSTEEVFGDLGDSATVFAEASPYSPSSPYSATKAGADHLVRAWGRTFDLPVIVTHCSNNYGPCQFPEKLIPHMILNALAGDTLPLYGDGQQVRDWIYVEDHARALWAVAMGGKVDATYNIGADNEQRNLEVVLRVCDLLERHAPLHRPAAGYASLITFVRDRPGHDQRYALNTSRLRRELGWAPRESFAAGLEKTVRWYLDNPRWWQRVLDGSYRLARLGKGQ